ncbi:MAG TPA: SAM-dependent methyltransferase [Thermoanaerobaculia bacterium]|nr:SAM-dependent methyltransferase [Thermoanaerobaculia bacterium]
MISDRLRATLPLPFAAFMEEALYGEGGYYRREDLAIGEAGDFVTGSSLSSLFGRATARLLQRLDPVLGRPAELFEAGYGTGAHLAHVLSSLEERGRRVRAWDRVQRPAPAGATPLSDLSEIQDGSIEGLIFSYELFDALPFHRLICRADGSVGELWVDHGEDGGFAWRERELSDTSLLDVLGSETRLQPGQVADLAPGWAPLYGELARKLDRGLLVTCDYGYERERLLDPRVRMHGTLACYSRQRVHRNPFVLVGEQDLTAHVDFTTIRQAGEAAGLTTFAFTRQALWLAACGLFEDLQKAPPQTRLAAMALLDGEGMGEDIRVLVQTRGIDPAEVLPGLS